MSFLSKILNNVTDFDLSVAALRLRDDSRAIVAPINFGLDKIFLKLFANDETDDARLVIQKAAIHILERHKIEFIGAAYDEGRNKYTGVIINEKDYGNLLKALERGNYVYGASTLPRT